MTAVGQAGRAAHVQRRGAPTIDDAARDMGVVALVALPFAVVAPVATSVVALAAFGVVHTFLELRWVLARFSAFLGGRFLAALAVPATAIALARLTGAPRAVEILAGFTLLGLGVAQGARTGRLNPAATVIAAGALAVGLAASLDAPVMYGIVLAHLHNVVTGVLLWDWAGDAADAGDAAGAAQRRRLRAGLVVLFAVLPALILAGAFDAFLPGSVSGIVPKTVAPGWASATAGVRLMAVFAFLQLVHYGVWCWLLPRRSTSAPFDRRATSTLAAFVVAAGLLALVFSVDLATGRTLYTSLATYHAYLEFPVVLLLLGGSRVPR